MNPSPAATAWIQGYVTANFGGWSGVSNAQVLAAVNAPSIANPVAQATVPRAYTFASLLGLLSQASAANIESFPALSKLFDDILAQNSANVLAAIALMGASGRIQSSEATALTAAVNATQLDPSWPSQISPAQANLGRPADIEDISAARPPS